MRHISGVACGVQYFWLFTEREQMKKMNTQMAPAIRAKCQRRAGGHYLAEVPWLLEVLACGKPADENEALALRVLADQLDHSEATVHNISFELLVPA